MVAWLQVASYQCMICMTSESLAHFTQRNETCRVLHVWYQESLLKRRALQFPSKVERRLLTTALHAFSTNRAQRHNMRRAKHHLERVVLAATLQRWQAEARDVRLWRAAVAHFNGRCVRFCCTLPLWLSSSNCAG